MSASCNAYLHVFHVFHDVALILFGSASRHLLGQRLLPQFRHLALAFSLCCGSGIKAIFVIGTLHKVRVAVPIILKRWGIKVLELWFHSHVERCSLRWMFDVSWWVIVV